MSKSNIDVFCMTPLLVQTDNGIAIPRPPHSGGEVITLFSTSPLLNNIEKYIKLHQLYFNLVHDLTRIHLNPSIDSWINTIPKKLYAN